jgi:endoglucanase Acf2
MEAVMAFVATAAVVGRLDKRGMFSNATKFWFALLIALAVAVAGPGETIARFAHTFLWFVPESWS